MHKRVLELAGESGRPVFLRRIGSGRQVTILAAYLPGEPSPAWIAKCASAPHARERLRDEFAALNSLREHAEVLHAPRVLRWEDAGEATCLIETGIPGTVRRLHFAPRASARDLDRAFQRPLAWLQRFHNTVAAPAAITTGAYAAGLASELERESEYHEYAPDLMELLAHPPEAAFGLCTVSHGDFFYLNVLITNTGTTGVVDWDHFAARTPLYDYFSFIVNCDYYDRMGLYPASRAYAHVFFSASPVCDMILERFRSDAIGAAAGRFYFYCFLVSRLLTERSTPPPVWKELLRWLRALDYPAVGAALPPPPR